MSTGLGAFAEAVTAPTYVVHGSRDQMVPVADAEHLAHTIPGAALEVLPGGSRTLMVRSAEARQRVITWIDRVDHLLRSPPSPARE